MSDYHHEDSFQDFNFWPSFTDLMLSLVLVMVLSIIVVRLSIEAGTVNLKEVQSKQVQMVDRIAQDFHATYKEDGGKDVFSIPVRFLLNGVSSESEITISNEPTLQRFSFKDRILFPSNQYQLSPEGKQTLAIVGNAIKAHLGDVREIQIQGHADTDRTFTHQSNLHLAALRSIEVFNFLKNEVGIDPARYLMSATSFGEFKPVGRSDHDPSFDEQKLGQANSSTDLKSRNRRIDILLFYRYRGDLSAQASQVEASPAAVQPAAGRSAKTARTVPAAKPDVPPDAAASSVRPVEVREEAPPIRVASSLLLSRLAAAVTTRYQPVAFDKSDPEQAMVEIVVDPEGNVQTARLISGPQEGKDAILRDIQTWRFKPLYTDGRGTSMSCLLAVKAKW